MDLREVTRCGKRLVAPFQGANWGSSSTQGGGLTALPWAGMSRPLGVKAGENMRILVPPTHAAKTNAATMGLQQIE